MDAHPNPPASARPEGASHPVGASSPPAAPPENALPAAVTAAVSAAYNAGLSAAAATTTPPPSAKPEPIGAAAGQPDPSSKLGSKIPPAVMNLGRLTPDYLPQDGEHLLAHVEAAIEEFQPVTMVDYLDVVRIGRLQHGLANLYAIKDAFQLRTRRLAARQTLRPGWTQPTPGKVEAATMSAMTMNQEVHASALREANRVEIGDKAFELDLEYFDHDGPILEEVYSRLKTADISRLWLDAEAFRLGLGDHMKIADVIASDESRLASLISDYERRRARRPAPVIDAEFEPA